MACSRRKMSRAFGVHRSDRRDCIASCLPVLKDLFAEFVDSGGQVWLCGSCTKPRGITEEQVSKGATIVGAAKVIEEVVAGARTVAFAYEPRGTGDGNGGRRRTAVTAGSGPSRAGASC